MNQKNVRSRSIINIYDLTPLHAPLSLPPRGGFGEELQARSDPEFLPGSGSAFEISLDPDPVSGAKVYRNCSKSYLQGKKLKNYD